MRLPGQTFSSADEARNVGNTDQCDGRDERNDDGGALLNRSNGFTLDRYCGVWGLFKFGHG